MVFSGHETANDAVLVTIQRQRDTIIIAVCVAGMLMDKIKRRKLLPGLKSSDSTGPAESKPAKLMPRRSARMFSFANKSTPPAVNGGPKLSDQSEPKGQDQSGDPVVLLTQRLHNAAQDGGPAYAGKRSALLADERKHTWDAKARDAATEAERAAGAILLKIREHERDDPALFGNLPGEAVPDPDTRDMGGHFLFNKSRIEQSDVFRIAKAMPKGAHLHLHFNSELPPKVLFPEAARLVDTMFIRSTRALCSQFDFDEAEIVFSVMPEGTARGNIFTNDYRPEFKAAGSTAWMRWCDFRQEFPGKIQFEDLPENQGELDAAERWAQSKMIISLNHAYDAHQTTNGAWACFNQGTRAFKGLVNYESVYRWYVRAIVDSMIRDKVMYAELRPMLLDKSIPTDDGVGHLDHKAQMEIICHEVRQKQNALEAEGKLNQFPCGLKIIYCTPRSIPKDRMKTELEDCLKLKLAFPDLICGFDLVGAEDRPNHVGFYADLLDAFAKTCKELKVDIPFMFHAGETLIDTGGSHNPDNSNLYDSLLLNAKRIGHGYSLLKHPKLVEQYKAKNICLELCPISNELLHLCGNARQHIFPELLAAGLHCTLNADNPSLFSSSLSHEFYQVMVGDPRMNIHGWRQLAEWSLEHSCLGEVQLQSALKIFHGEWEAFCKWVVAEYQTRASGLKDII